MKFISPKTNKVYDLPFHVSVKIPPELVEEIKGKDGIPVLQIAETRELKLTMFHEVNWGDEEDKDLECQTGFTYVK